MAKTIELSVRKREITGRRDVRRIRANGRIPAVIYGKTTPPAHLELEQRDVLRALQRSGENALVSLQSEGAAATLAVIQEVQHHPVSGAVLHVDFHALAANERFHTHIPLEMLGTPVGVKTSGGVLETLLRSLEVSCLPKDLPDLVQIDVSNLEIGQSLHVSDLTLPEGVSALTSKDIVVCHVIAPRADEAPAPAAAAAATPEVIKEKKPEGDKK